VAAEIARHVPRLADKRKLDQALLLAALQVMPIGWKPASVYEDHREQAESRIAARDPDDWPTLALALKLGVPIWSQDKDFSAAGVSRSSQPASCWTRYVLEATSRHSHDGPSLGPGPPTKTGSGRRVVCWTERLA
jgi:predicted nucleic acid-binding protein